MEETIIEFRTLEEIEETLEDFSHDLHSLKQGMAYRKNMAKKFYINGKVIANVGNEKKLGFVAFYCNNLSNRTAYISMIAVKNEVRCSGVGGKLLYVAEKIALDNGMSNMQLEVAKTNDNAIAFYKKHEYVLYESREDTFIYTKKLK